MPARVIGYDLSKPGQEYDDLFEAIKNVGTTWWHCLDSTWIVITDQSPSDIRDALSSHLDANDSLAVFTLTSGWATTGLSDDCNDWLHNNL